MSIEKKNMYRNGNCSINWLSFIVRGKSEGKREREREKNENKKKIKTILIITRETLVIWFWCDELFVDSIVVLPRSYSTLTFSIYMVNLLWESYTRFWFFIWDWFSSSWISTLNSFVFRLKGRWNPKYEQKQLHRNTLHAWEMARNTSRTHYGNLKPNLLRFVIMIATWHGLVFAFMCDEYEHGKWNAWM